MTERFDFEKMLAAVEKYRVTYMPVSPPLVVAMAKAGFGIEEEVAERFKSRFPNVEILQGYGLTETTGGVTGMNGPDESRPAMSEINKQPQQHSIQKVPPAELEHLLQSIPDVADAAVIH
ncbi:hypothetical protein HAX54_009529 [Datura stramonium]|uniref:AMP-dependent synthetase/ligase domain-containing protein n=1 Tax=Datura stramonium TaxID=4076 RepID=A0ABS8RW75_DATST|nr:hypothetical protein [Datura stramonium]